MNKYFFPILIFFFSFVTYSQENNECDINISENSQKKLNEHYSNKEKSPLMPKDLKKFKGLNFFKLNSDFCFKAKLLVTPNQEPFNFQTTRGHKATYVKYGEIHFEYNNKKYSLEAYARIPKNNEKSDNSLFVPFTDLTSGDTTYGGGRYLDYDIPTNGEIILDFNQCYNPYCAYNNNYSCPITPEVNHLEILIEAGVKKFKD